MNLPDLLIALDDAGVRLSQRDRGLRLSGKVNTLPQEVIAAATAHKPALLPLLNGDEVAARSLFARLGMLPTVAIGSKQYPYLPRWAGQPLSPSDGFLAFDTETEVVDLHRLIPRLALAAASAGEEANCLIHPDDVGAFVLAHEPLHFICHHAAFDFWVVEQHLRQRGEEQARKAWWEIAAANRLHDSMLLEMLVRLARNDSFPDPRDLAVVARQYAGLEISKDDPYRMRYGEILGQDWDRVERGFFEYGVKDAIVTRPAYLALRTQALALVEEFGRHSSDILPDAPERFGLLTEAIQVKKAIALAQITRNGMQVDQQCVRQAEADLRRRLNDAVACVRKVCPGLYKTDKEGNLVCTGKVHTPSKSKGVLVAQLQQVAHELKEESGVELPIPLTQKSGQLSASTRFWGEYQEQHPFLRHWIEAEELAKLLQFFTHLQADQVHPRYSTLVRTGRTSCTGPNVQQMPRDGAFRQAFVPSPGHYLLAVDYSFIELRTFAATALRRYGWSDMAEVIKRGVDPHAHTAAMMLGVEPDQFLTWKDNETVVTMGDEEVKLKERFDKARQMAKPVNFGVPGGLGVASLVGYAHSTYRVDFTVEEAKQRREQLTKQIYRELDLYLAEDGVAIVARNLQAPVEQVRRELGDIHLSSVRKILAGDPRKADGNPYQPGFVDRVWAILVRINRNPDLQEALEKRQPGEELAARVCHAGVATLTGRIRGRVRYSQARNTPFQGLAADGAALALFNLVREGFRVVGFIHDEVLVELPDEGGHVSEAKVLQVKGIMCREMESVLVGDIPVGCEAALCTRWHKKAKLIVKDGKVLPWEPEGQAPAARPVQPVQDELAVANGTDTAAPAAALEGTGIREEKTAYNSTGPADGTGDTSTGGGGRGNEWPV
jgi:DNA polymerase I-like protein with 3'-5' exonuclease and polymerase domains